MTTQNKKRYFPSEIEEKWRKKWQKAGLYKQANIKAKGSSKFYTLVELPYPSGDLHIGHWFTFVAPDVLSRFLRMNGKNVFFPMGFDAFGLPAENAAIKRGVHPRDWTMRNIETMTKQFHTMGTMINWDNVTITSLPEYYRWNQWIFLKMYEKGLAYRDKMLSNWCPVDQTVLANEHVADGRCWRCGSIVEQKEVEQWFLKITNYAEKLLWPENGADSPEQSQVPDGTWQSRRVDWPKSVQVAQNEWIGRSEGVQIEFKIQSARMRTKIETFTTAIDTVFGVSFIALAPEHPLVTEILNLNSTVISFERLEEIAAYLQKTKQKTELERKEEAKVKTGVFTGLYAINPFNGKQVPIWVADYVLMSYGTGAVMGVPGHDARDYEFAKKFGLEIIKVIKPTKPGKNSQQPKIESDRFWDYREIKTKYKDNSVLVNSDSFDGMSSRKAKEKITDMLIKKGWGKRVTTYHLHDWSVSRQRYWGTPVPMIHCSKCGMVPVPEKDLPVELPYNVDYTPKGKPPLASNEEWLAVKCPNCQGKATRDPETLDTFFDSSWYYYRYVNPNYAKGPFDKKKVKALMPVDVYFGGGEHTLGHTLYARFFTKFFKDLGLVDFDEFAKKRIQHGIVLGPDGNKMSKSKGNVINPDDVVKEFGTDAVRVYLTFMMPYEATGPWSTEAMHGTFRFLKRVWELQYLAEGISEELTNEDFYHMHTAIAKVTRDIQSVQLNTAVAALMEWLNYLSKKEGISEEEYRTFLLLLAPFAPHMTEELYSSVILSDPPAGGESKDPLKTKKDKRSIHQHSWPMSDKKYLVANKVVIPVQVNGRLRGTITTRNEELKTKNFVQEMAKKDETISKHLEGKSIKKVIYVPGKIINFVVV